MLVNLDKRGVNGQEEEAKVLIEQWRKEYNQVRLHCALGYCLPAPKVIIPVTLT
jgi:putative transposase